MCVSTIKRKHDLKLGTVLVLDSQLKAIDCGLKRSRVKVTGFAWVFWDCCRTHDEEPLPLSIFIHADDVVQRRGVSE